MQYQMEYQTAGCVWQNGRVEWVDKTKKFDASTDEDALIRAKAILFDEGMRSTVLPKLKKVYQAVQKEAVREVSLA